jgi:hypothetical protein
VAVADASTRSSAPPRHHVPAIDSGEGRDAMYSAMTRTASSPIGDALAHLQTRVVEPPILAGAPAYDEARHVWNGMIDKHPALIVRCHGPDDVIASVRFAMEHQLLLAVRGGGHNVAGFRHMRWRYGGRPFGHARHPSRSGEQDRAR